MAVRGSASIDTGRFPNKDKQIQDKLSRTFPRILKQRVDMKKVVFKAVKPWIKQEIDSVLGFEDDVVVNLVYNLLETQQYPDGRAICVELMGFLDKDTMSFMERLWGHLVDAANSKLGIPTKLLADAQKKQKIKKEQTTQSADRFKMKQELEQHGNVKYNPPGKRGDRGRGQGRGRGRLNNDNRSRFRDQNRRDDNEYGPKREHNQNDQHRDRDNQKEYREFNDDYDRSNRRDHGNHRDHKYRDRDIHRHSSDEEQRDSMNSIWPPSPSPPAILKTLKTLCRSPSPPKELKNIKIEPTESYRPKSILKKSKRSPKRHRSVSRSRSLSHSRSRSRSRSWSRERSRSRKHKSAKKRKHSWKHRKRRSYSRSTSLSRSHSRSRSPSYSRSRSRSRSRSGSRGRWNY